MRALSVQTDKNDYSCIKTEYIPGANNPFGSTAKVIKISQRKENSILSDLLDVSVDQVKKIKKIYKKDRIMSLKKRQFSNPIDTDKSDMLISIENGILTWLDFYDDVSRLAKADKLYALQGVPESSDYEKEEITKMRTFLYHFYNHGFWNISSTCEYIGVSLVDVQNWSMRYHSFKDSMKLMMSARHDFAESQLLKQMDGTGMPSVTATIFYLRTMGRERGWGEETTLNVNDSRADMTKEQVDKIAESYKARMLSNIYKNRNNAILPGHVAGNNPADTSNHDLSDTSNHNPVVAQAVHNSVKDQQAIQDEIMDSLKDHHVDNPFEKTSRDYIEDDDVFEIY